MLSYISNRDGARIAVLDEGAGLPVLLLHGPVEDHTVWEPVARALRRDCRVVRFDFRGHGASALLATPTLQDLVNDVVEVVRGLNLQRPVLVGHSAGAAVATICAGIMELGGVVSVEQVLRFGSFQAQLKELEPALRGPEFSKALWALVEAPAASSIPGDVLERLRAFREQARASVVLSLWEPLLTLHPAELDAISEQMVRAVSVPYLAVHGSDPGPEYRTWLGRRLPASELEILPEGGHWPHLGSTTRFLQLLRDFLARTQIRAQ